MATSQAPGADGWWLMSLTCWATMGFGFRPGLSGGGSWDEFNASRSAGARLGPGQQLARVGKRLGQRIG